MTDLEALKANLRDDAHMTQRDGLAAMLATAEGAADAIERLEADAIAMTTYRENLRDECRELLAKVERLEAENAKLRDALEPFAFREMENEDGLADTQYVWETVYSDRVQDWFSYEEIEAARAALAVENARKVVPPYDPQHHHQH